MGRNGGRSVLPLARRKRYCRTLCNERQKSDIWEMFVGISPGNIAEGMKGRRFTRIERRVSRFMSALRPGTISFCFSTILYAIVVSSFSSPLTSHGDKAALYVVARLKDVSGDSFAATRSRNVDTNNPWESTASLNNEAPQPKRQKAGDRTPSITWGRKNILPSRPGRQSSFLQSGSFGKKKELRRLRELLQGKGGNADEVHRSLSGDSPHPIGGGLATRQLTPSGASDQAGATSSEERDDRFDEQHLSSQQRESTSLPGDTIPRRTPTASQLPTFSALESGSHNIVHKEVVTRIIKPNGVIEVHHHHHHHHYYNSGPYEDGEANNKGKDGLLDTDAADTVEGSMEDSKEPTSEQAVKQGETKREEALPPSRTITREEETNLKSLHGLPEKTTEAYMHDLIDEGHGLMHLFNSTLTGMHALDHMDDRILQSRQEVTRDAKLLNTTVLEALGNAKELTRLQSIQSKVLNEQMEYLRPAEIKRESVSFAVDSHRGGAHSVPDSSGCSHAPSALFLYLLHVSVLGLPWIFSF